MENLEFDILWELWNVIKGIGDKYLNFGHSAHSSDKDDFSDVGLAYFGILHGLVTRFDGLLDQIADNILELRARQLQVIMQSSEWFILHK